MSGDRRMVYALLFDAPVDSAELVLRESAFAEKVFPRDFQLDYEGRIYCPGCGTLVSRVPRESQYFSNGRLAHFKHYPNQGVGCDLRSIKPEGRRYHSYEEAMKAIENQSLVLVAEFAKQIPALATTNDSEYSETVVEDESGKPSDITIGRHNGETVSLPGKISTVAGICRRLDLNLKRYYALPGMKLPFLLLDLLHSVKRVKEVEDRKRLYVGKVLKSLVPANSPRPDNICMVFLSCHDTVKDFCIKITVEEARHKRLLDDPKGKYVMFYGSIVKSGIGLALERPAWGELAVVPMKYRDLLDANL